MAIAQATIEPSAEQVGIFGRVQGVHLAGKVVERLAIIELTFEGREGTRKLDGRVLANRAGELLGNRQRLSQSGHRKSPLGGAGGHGYSLDGRSRWASQELFGTWIESIGGRRRAEIDGDALRIWC